MNLLFKQFNLVLLCLFLALSQPLIGQRSGNSNSNTSTRPVTQSYALTGAHIIQAPGKEIQKGTVLIQDGLITSVGTNISIPGEAQVIEMDSLYIYAGFIDGMSHAGIPKPKPNTQASTSTRSRGQGRSDAANPPNADAGIQPERMVRDLIDPKDGSIAALRKVGFTAAHVVPRGRMLPGSGAIVLLGGEKADEMIVVEQSSFFAQFVTASGVYPSTLLGIMAKWRDLYRQAELAKGHEARYASKPLGMKRPAYDQAITSFFPVLDQKVPVFFKTEKALEAYRALALSQELGFPLVLAGLQQGWDVMKPIQAANASVFLSLDLPKAEKAGKQKSTDSAKELTEIEKEAEALKKRKAEAYKQSCSQAATFAEAGIPFGLTTEGAKEKEIPAHLRTMIEHGLSDVDALAALTTQPAQLLGVSAIMGTVERGKLANLVVSDKPYFEEKSNVRYVFVEGEKFEIEAPKKNKKGISTGAAVKAVGLWTYTVETPQGASEGTLTITGEEGEYSGTIYVEMLEQSIPLSSIELEGNELMFNFTIDAGGQTMEIEGSGIIDGEDMEGEMQMGGMGEASFEAQRTGDPE